MLMTMMLSVAVVESGMVQIQREEEVQQEYLPGRRFVERLVLVELKFQRIVGIPCLWQSNPYHSHQVKVSARFQWTPHLQTYAFFNF